MGCPDLNNPDVTWNFCPNLGAAIFFAILFAFTTVAHIVQAIVYRKSYCWVIAMGALWQTANYVFRILSIQNPYKQSYYIAWFILILLAPLWTNAFVYMVMGRMIWNFSEKPQIWGVKAWRTGLYFVLLDITAFLIQMAGASIASGTGTSQQTKTRGLDIYMGGVGFQQFFVLVFIALAITFQRGLTRRSLATRSPGVMQLLYVQYAVLALITTRIIFRLVEYSSGFESSIPKHEAYQYCLDSLPMFIALVLFNIYHPGRIMPGKESDLPSRKERKRLNNAMSTEGGNLQVSSTELVSQSSGPSKSAGYGVLHRGRDSEAVPAYGYVR